jgi:hypothetical protein
MGQVDLGSYSVVGERMLLDGEMLRTLFLLAGMATYMGAGIGLALLTLPEP